MNTTNLNTTKTPVTKPPLPRTPGAQTSAPVKPMPTNRGATILKTTLVVGSIVATLMGANLAARQDQTMATTPVITAAYSNSIQANQTQSLATLPNLPATDLGTANISALLNAPLAPIPSISIPAPVTNSRSSR